MLSDAVLHQVKQRCPEVYRTGALGCRVKDEAEQVAGVQFEAQTGHKAIGVVIV
jgi:hypothetical protein